MNPIHKQPTPEERARAEAMFSDAPGPVTLSFDDRIKEMAKKAEEEK